jgi:MSHA type pilus biogenesis protein MshL
VKPIAAATLASALALAGCATQRAAQKEPPLKVSVSKDPAPPLQPLPDAPVEAVEGVKTSTEEFRRPSRRYTLALTGADARELFLSLARENDLNILISPDVTGAVTLDIKGATAPEIIEEACLLVKCKVEYAGRMVRILPLRRESRFFDVDYILGTRSGQGLLAASSATSTGSSSGSSGGGGGGGDSDNKSINQINTDEKAEMFTTLVEEVKALLSDGEAKVVLNKTAGTLSVTDYPQNLDRVAAYLRNLTERSHTGVLIEAQILEVTLNDETQYGIDWSTPGLSLFGVPGGLTGGAVMSQSLQSGVGSGAKIGLAGTNATVFMDALATYGQINVLSAPKVATLNNQKAIIRIGRQDIFFRATVIPATTTTAAVVTYNPDTVTEGIILAVTPQVGRNGQVLLAIHPSITERVGTAVAPDRNTAPIIDVRETNTVVAVHDGKTVVIGGMMQERTQEIVSSVPFLGSIPFLGALFRNTDQIKKKTELVILITPRIVPPTSLSDIGERDFKRASALDQGYHFGGRPGLYGVGAETKLGGWGK